jgi:hypothetical protein
MYAIIQESNELRMALPEDSEGVVMGVKREVLRKAGEGLAQLAGTTRTGRNSTKPKALLCLNSYPIWLYLVSIFLYC